ncbi:hypothetical protein BDY19DRAFT_932375 [Irpex rosettiformis]|uniref:Uncharacterized protein n=1 Tax=Irpex rosettiformis TaxID=378272 RepID=A0ACB8U9C8_9APHY|nr:hypothetical protein BDY19DRAFT_932375 [Irpex rosettiformis]
MMTATNHMISPRARRNHGDGLPCTTLVISTYTYSIYFISLSLSLRKFSFESSSAFFVTLGIIFCAVIVALNLFPQFR